MSAAVRIEAVEVVRRPGAVVRASDEAVVEGAEVEAWLLDGW